MFKAFIKARENPIGNLDLLCAFSPTRHTRESKEEKPELSKVRRDRGTSAIGEPENTRWDNDDEVNDFFNRHMPELQDIIAMTARQIDASRYRDHQKYLFAVFEQSSEKCWQYVKDITENGEEEIKPAVLEKLTEESVKETAMAVATTFFIQLAVISMEKAE